MEKEHFTLLRASFFNRQRIKYKNEFLQKNYLEVIKNNFNFSSYKDKKQIRTRTFLINRRISTCEKYLKFSKKRNGFYDPKKFSIVRNEKYKKKEGDKLWKIPTKKEGDKRKNLPFYLRDFNF